MYIKQPRPPGPHKIKIACIVRYISSPFSSFKKIHSHHQTVYRQRAVVAGRNADGHLLRSGCRAVGFDRDRRQPRRCAVHKARGRVAIDVHRTGPPRAPQLTVTLWRRQSQTRPAPVHRCCPPAGTASPPWYSPALSSPWRCRQQRCRHA